MAYRQDPNLKFLKEMNDEDLNELVYCLTHDNDGKPRYTENLTKSERYKEHYPQHSKYWEDIACELQYFGANSIKSAVLGKGVTYDEILSDVYKKIVKETLPKDISIEDAEDKLLTHILSPSIEKISPEQRQELAKALNFDGDIQNITPQMFMAALQTILKLGGPRSYLVANLIVNAIYKAIFKQGLNFAANVALARGVAILAGPIGWTISGIWATLDITGPAYRVTIPAVIQIAALRKKYIKDVEDLQQKIDEAIDIDPNDL